MTIDPSTAEVAGGAPPRVVVHPDAELLARAAAARLLLTLLDAQSVTSPLHVALTGGTMGNRLLGALAADPLRDAVDWTHVHLWWGDERFLPDGDPERNETQARAALIDSLPVPAANVHAVPGPDDVADVHAAAGDYAAELASWADGEPLPRFAVVLLGVGPDGHVASLFPHRHSLGVDDVATVAELDSPKAPPQRVSLTLPALCSTEQVWFVVAGDDKSAAVSAALGGRDLDPEGRPVAGPVVPAGRVRGSAATLWLIDVEAAADVAG